LLQIRNTPQAVKLCCNSSAVLQKFGSSDRVSRLPSFSSGEDLLRQLLLKQKGSIAQVFEA
jgi:hypothetical protein